MNKILHFIIVTLAIAFFSAAQAMPDATTSSSSDMEKERDYIQAKKKLDSLASNGDLNKLDLFVEQSQSEWKSKDRKYYLAFTHMAISAFTSRSYGTKNVALQKILAQKYARTMLRDHQNLSLTDETLFMLPLLSEDISENDKTQLSIRREKTVFICRLWLRMKKNIDTKFDARDDSEAVNTIPLIVRAKGQFNMPPSLIKDPSLRAEYEAALNANQKKKESRNVQFEIRRLDRNYSRTLENFVISTYSKPPFNLPELKQLLDKYEIGEEREKRILDAVIAQMKYAVEGATSLQSTPPPLPSIVPTPEPTPQATPSPTHALKQ